jgi:CheY-like chemotaxis protein
MGRDRSLDASRADRDRAPSRGRVVYVDDDADYAHMFTLFLERLGYAVITCYDRVGALEVLQMLEGHCDLFISDCELRGEDGIDLACEIAAKYPGIAVGVISNVYDAIALRAVARGVPAAVKPDSRDGFLALIARFKHRKAY